MSHVEESGRRAPAAPVEHTGGRRFSRADAVALVVSIAVLVATAFVASARRVGALEEAAFEAFNGLPDALAWAVWPPMQAGAILAVPAAALAALVAWRRWRPAASLLAAGLAAWLLAKAAKAVAERGRPATYLDGVELRGGSVGGGHNEGLGFPSGHAAIAFALAAVATGYLPARRRWVPFALAVAVSAGRLYFGAHLPLDVVGGAGLGVALGIAARLALGGPPSRRRLPARAGR